MTVLRLDPVTDERWAAFVARAPGADAFHHPAWLGLLRDEYRYPMLALCVADDGGGGARSPPGSRSRGSRAG